MEDQIELIYRDNGSAIPHDFDRYHTDSMGLNRVKILADKLLKRSIVMESTKGTKFIITFNIAEA